MNRRNLFSKLAALPFMGVALAKPVKKFEVATLEQLPTTHMKVRWTFNTYEEAETFVKSLRPVPIDMSESRYGQTYFAIKIGDTDSFLVEDGVGIFFSIDHTWGYLYNIRINTSPVDFRLIKGKTLPKHLTEYCDLTKFYDYDYVIAQSNKYEG